MIRRKDIRGWTIKLGQYRLEYVSIKHIPTTLELSNKNGINTIWRIGK